MRMAYYPGSSAYPSWVKPVLVSIGAMFVASSAFLIILIWKSEPLAGPKPGAQATAAAPALTGAMAAGPAAGPSAPGTISPGPAAASAVEVPSTQASGAPADGQVSRAHRRSHHRSHQKIARGSRGKHHRSHDPLLDLIN